MDVVLEVGHPDQRWPASLAGRCTPSCLSPPINHARHQTMQSLLTFQLPHQPWVMRPRCSNGCKTSTCASNPHHHPPCRYGAEKPVVFKSNLLHLQRVKALSFKGTAAQQQRGTTCQCCVIIMQGDHLNVITLSDLSASFKGILLYQDGFWSSFIPKNPENILFLQLK